MSTEPDTQDIGEQTANDLEAVDEDVTTSQRWYAYAYLTVLFSLIVASIAAAVYFGILSPSIRVEAVANIGWILEYVALFIAIAFVVFTTAMVLIALPGSIMGGMVRVVARIADNYEMPQDATRRPSERFDSVEASEDDDSGEG